ncbi:hypothetical protein NX059_001525 [Plenodomus lindquistii]|nr:hypothetical protein NX059_001525 [Plenodomus lindquistii]
MRTTLRGPSAAQTAMATASGNTGSGNPDMALIGALLEDIARNPSAITARKLLVEHYISIGWLDAALDNTLELRKLAPGDLDVIKSLQLLERKPQLPAPGNEKKSVSISSIPAMQQREWDPKAGNYKTVTRAKASKGSDKTSLTATFDRDVARRDLAESYVALQKQASFVLNTLRQLQKLQKQAGVGHSPNIPKIEAIANGRKAAPTSNHDPPKSARSVARTVRDNPAAATDILITDLEHAMNWMRTPSGKFSDADNDKIRDYLVKRRKMLSLALPEHMRIHCDLALMHMEHEHLGRNYANTETMLMDDVKDIPRENFYVTEDNYAWDISELVNAIKANSGVLRNPLSKEMFTPHDIKGILMHPLGKPLAALAVEQHEMSKGIRIATIEKMETLARILLEDQSSETIPSRIAVDEFLVYIATLPEVEQKAIDGFKCPATDSHTGQSYDFTIGESVRDAKGNRVCFHKAGDFIRQAAAHLRQNQNAGAPPTDEKCIVM